RELTFTYELPEDIGWQPREEVVLPAEVNAYEGLCKLAVGTISRIVYLPRETNFDRALLSREGVIRPTGATINIRGNNFRGMFGLRDQDFSSDGLAFNGTHLPYLEVGNHASTRSLITIDNDKYTSIDIGPHVAL